uniref:Transferrin n=1 Tax=Pristhesancus plagipennis TaxID=1955184 RepID=A0A1Q1NPJ1_PRIPG|nr:venom transferrin-like protein 1 [Pristhesancus plagipennis]
MTGLQTYVFALLLAAIAVQGEHGPFKICVPQMHFADCVKMMEDGKAANVPVKCVSARDRYECASKIESHKADFEALDPEDMYNVAILNKNEFDVIKEIRTKEEPNAEFRYEAVAVIPKDLNINNIKDGLKGLRSCHTGVGRNVGYKIPLTKLTQMGIIPPMDDDALSPREQELKALSTLFSKACLVGTWSPHPETNQRLKATYKNLCELCEHPEKCDYPDENSGYEGALKCLTKGGQVAWTKVIFVKKFFGMAYGSQPAKKTENDPEKYAYLCPDGTKKPVTGEPCTWAARPWQGYMATKQISNEYKALREVISKLNNLGENKHADWITTVLLLSDKTLAADNKIQTPLEYLKTAKYYDVIGRDVVNPSRHTRFCVTNNKEMEKCEELKIVSFSRDIRPKLGCVLKKNFAECMDAIINKNAEVYVADAQDAIIAEQKYNMKALINEQYNNENKQVLVAVVKKGSTYKDLASLKGKKACLVQNGKSGFNAVLQYLIEKKLISKSHCPYEKAMAEFFASVQQSNDPVECIVFGQGDVAFVPYSSLHGSEKGDLEIICPDGGRKPITQAESCGLVTVPPRMVMVRSDMPAVHLDEVRHSVLSAGSLFSKNPEYFLMFGDFKGEANLIFSNHATGLVAVSDVIPAYEEYKKLVKDLAICNA